MLAWIVLLASAACATSGRPVAAVDLAPGLYLDGRKIAAAEWAAHKDALDRLTDKFLGGVRPPFVLGRGERVLPAADDRAYDPVREGRFFVEIPQDRYPGFSVSKPHEAIDVGSRILHEDGTLRFLGLHEVWAIHPGGLLQPGDFHVRQKLSITEGRYVLSLELVYAHVHPIRPRASGPIGVLFGEDKWESLDRHLPGSFKGNHVHLEVRGINDLELEHYIERRRPSGGRPDALEYIRYRERFLNERLFPLLLGSR